MSGSRVKGFQLPPLDRHIADNTEAFHILRDTNEKGEDLADFNKIGFTIGRTAIQGVVEQEHVLSNIIKEYKKIQPVLASHGILSGEARILEGSTVKMCCSTALTLEALTLDRDALEIARPFMMKEPEEGQVLVQIPSPYLFSSENDNLWRHIFAPDACPYVTLTAITGFNMTVLVHSKPFFEEWEKLIVGGQGEPSVHPKTHILSSFMQEAIEKRFNQLTFEVAAGQTIVTHRSMPLKLHGKIGRAHV